MLLERVREVLGERLAAWGSDKNLAVPAQPPLAPAPAHVAADLALSFPLAVAKAAKANPMAVAEELKGLLKDPLFAEVSAAKPGFLNIRLSEPALRENLSALRAAPERYGTPAQPRGGKVLIEFVSANPVGPLHLASGRAGALGDCLVRILRRLGTEAAAEYYINDGGGRIELLGESVKARYEQAHGRDAIVPEKGYRGEYLKDVAAAAPPEAAGWDAARWGAYAADLMIAAHRRDMDDYRVHFDRWFKESSLFETGAVQRTVEFLKERGMTYEKDGALWLGTSAAEAGDDKDRVLIKSDGKPAYFLPDIAYHKDKFDRGWKTLVDIWGADHHGYVPRMRAAIAALGKPPESFHAIVHQLVHLFKGEELVKMSKRAGEFVSLRELMEGVGVDACRYFFAMHAPNTHMNFDYELAKKRSQENPVYYVQYVHARIASIFREAAERGFSAEDAGAVSDAPQERALLVKLVWFPRALEACAEEWSPHPLTTYLSELAGLYHAFYENCRVLDAADKARSGARLALCDGVAKTIKEGLGLLGVSAPDTM